MSSYHLKANNEAPLIKPEGETWTVEELQALVGGYWEILGVPKFPDKVLVVNELGKLRNLPLNKSASILYGRDVILGDAVITMKELIE
jgi:hypothetical protein